VLSIAHVAYENGRTRGFLDGIEEGVRIVKQTYKIK
jgi:hypothetical protein